MSLLLPGLQMAKIAAGQVVCKSNIHQMFLGIFQYSVDYDGRMVAPVIGYNNPNDIYRSPSYATGYSVNFGNLYAQGYLTDDGNLMLDPGNSYSYNRPSAAGMLNNKKKVLKAVKELKKSGSTCQGELWVGKFTYCMRGPLNTLGTVTTDSYGRVWDWPTNFKSYGYRYMEGTCSVLRNNYAGVTHYGRKYSFPLALIMCAIPMGVWGWDPVVHGRTAFNAGFADGSVLSRHTKKTDAIMLKISKWPFKFHGADTMYPNYREPFANYSYGF